MIKKGNLARDLKLWLMSTLQLGPGIGDVFYICPAASATSKFRAWLVNQGVDGAHIFTSLALAYAAATAYRNDVILAMPGVYVEAATCDWTKDYTHLIGLGGPNVYGRLLRPNCMIYCDIAGVDYTVHLTGNGCQFINIVIQNGTRDSGSATAGNLSAMKMAGNNNYFKNVGFKALQIAAQTGEVLCSSLEMAPYGGQTLFEDCVIGQNEFVVSRDQVTQGQMLIKTATPNSPTNIEFKRCRFLSRAETAGVPMVYSETYSADRMWLYDDCHFDNYWVNWAGICTEVFKHVAGGIQTANVTLRNCTARGYERWTATNITNTGGALIEANMPATAQGGGLTRAPSAVVGS